MRPVAAAVAAVTIVLVGACGGAGSPVTTLSPSAPATAARASAAPLRTAPPACAITASTAPAARAIIELEKGGTIAFTLRADKAPKTVANFANIARSGCYDGLTFHRVEPNFVIQGGDPLGTGTGGGQQPSEYNDLPFVKGAVGIARGNDKAINNAYQFYICIGECRFLDGQYTNFGLVTAGQALADAVKVGDKIKSIRVE
ncbi:MAG TPA: peptidylprolyl isomerase [Candidatus Saccharimonadales bacterium]|nr:peptidylprolyl isomerase [Candidatus Saccharimonadales bacterium]